MLDKIFMHLLILYGIWSQGITGTSAEEAINVSPNVLVRQKRVNELEQAENHQEQNNHAVAIIRNMQLLCVGNILSNYVAITASVCVEGPPSQYRVRSHAPLPRQFTDHNVREIRLRTGGHRRRARDGVGLIVVNPPFVYSAFCRNKPLHTEQFPPGILGKVTGWGVINYERGLHETNQPTGLRQIEVPLIARRDCADRYGTHIVISDTDVCTYHPKRHCSRIDLGTALIINRGLAAIFVGSGMIEGYIDPRYPDIFALLQSFYYRQWIESNSANLTAHYHNHRH